jgi:hypothetical protein
VRRLAVDIDDPELFQSMGSWEYRPRYAALRAEAAVLGHSPGRITAGLLAWRS